MRNPQRNATALVVALAALASGCGTPREKTAPCKRPANLTNYAGMEDKCGPMTPVNADRAAALAAIQDVASAAAE
jgi:hypothetical protein